MAPVTSVGSSQSRSLEGDGPGEDSESNNDDASSHAPEAREEDEMFLPLKMFSRMQVVSCMVQLENKYFIECSNKGCLYISLSLWDMAYHLTKCEGIRGIDKLIKCRYCPHGTDNVDVLNNHMILSHSYAPEVVSKDKKLEFKDLRQEERESFLTSPYVREIIRSHWRICLQTKGFIICLIQKCCFVTSLIPVMEDHYIRCSPQIWESLKYSCHRCRGKAPSREALDAHIEECHSSQNVTFNKVPPEAQRFWECSFSIYGASKCVNLHCKFISCNINELERHYRYCRVPHVENFEVCDYCGGWCDTANDKIQHIAILHSRANCNDESLETMREMHHSDVLRKLVCLDLNSASFPWSKIMSYGGEVVLNRIVEGIRENPEAPLPKKKNKQNVDPENDVKPVLPKKAIKQEKNDMKKVTSRRKSARASDIDHDVPLHAIKAEELFIPDKTFLEDLGQAIELESLEQPKLDVQVTVGDQSWTVAAPSLETASEVIARKMPSYSKKGVLAQSIEDSLNLLKLEAKVTSIENLGTKPYVPPKALNFASKPCVLEALKRKFDLIRKKEEKDKCSTAAVDSFMTGDFMSEEAPVKTPHPHPWKPVETAKRKKGRKEFSTGNRPWQSLARIKQPVPEPEPEPEYDYSSSDDALDDIPCEDEENELVHTTATTRCKILLPKRREPIKPDGNLVKNNKIDACEVTFPNDSQSNPKSNTTAVKRKSNTKKLPIFDTDTSKLVRDVCIQLGPSAFPVFTEQYLANRYSKADLLIGYPYPILKSNPGVRREDTFTQASIRNYSGRTYSGRPTNLNKKPPVFNTPVNNQWTHLTLAGNSSSSCFESFLEDDKKLVLVRTVAPIDPSNPTGSQILKESRVIGDLKQTVAQKLSRVGASGNAGVPYPVRFIRVPIHQGALNGSSRVPSSVIRNLVPCAPPGTLKPMPQVISRPSSANTASVVASNSRELVYSNCRSDALSVSNTASTYASDLLTHIKTELDKGDPKSLPLGSVEDLTTVSTVCPSSASSPSVLSSSAINTAVNVSSCTVLTPSGSSRPVLSVPRPTYRAVVVKTNTSCSPSILPLSPASVSVDTEVPGNKSAASDSSTIDSETSFGPSPSIGRSPTLKTYSPSPACRNILQTVKKRRLDTPGPLEGCSTEISLSQQGHISLVSSADSFSTSNKTKSLLKSYLRRAPAQLTSTGPEKSSCDCRSHAPDDSHTPRLFGIASDENYCDRCQRTVPTPDDGSGPSKVCVGPRNDKIVPNSMTLFDESQSPEDCYSFDPSVPFEVYCDSSIATHGGLYHGKFPWEGKTSSVVPSVGKTNAPGTTAPSETVRRKAEEKSEKFPGLEQVIEEVIQSARDQSISQDKSEPYFTSVHMEVEEGPVQFPGLRKVMEEVIQNCCDESSSKAESERNSEKVNDLAQFVTKNNELKVHNEPMVYALNKVIVDQPWVLCYQNLPCLESVNSYDKRRLLELVYYLTHYNNLQATNNPIIYIANKIVNNAPSTSRTSDGGSKDSGKGKKSLDAKEVGSRNSERVGISDVPKDAGQKGPTNKRLRKSAVGSSIKDSANQGELEEPKIVQDSGETKVEGTSVPLKKRKRKSIVEPGEVTSVVSLTNTNVDDANENDQSSKPLSSKRPSKPKKSVAAEKHELKHPTCTKKNVENLGTPLMNVDHPEDHKGNTKGSGKKDKNSFILGGDGQNGKPLKRPGRPKKSVAAENKTYGGNQVDKDQRKNDKDFGNASVDAENDKTDVEKSKTEKMDSSVPADADNDERQSSEQLPKRKPGRPKKSAAAENEGRQMHDKESGNAEVDVDQHEADIEKSRASSRKSKTSKPSDCLLEMEVEPGDDDVPRSGVMRARRAASKKSLEPTETDEDNGDGSSPPKPKRKGRQRKVDARTSEQGDDNNGNRFLYHDDDGEEEGDDLSRLCSRIEFNSPLSNPHKLVTCAICNTTLTAKDYKTSHLAKHNYICWLTTEEPMDLDDEGSLERLLYRAYCHLRKPFHCEVCGKTVKSAKGFISHRRFCGKSLEERRENMVECAVCSRLLKPSSYSFHMQNHHSTRADPSLVKVEPSELPSRAAATRCRQKLSLGAEGSSGPVHIDEDQEKAEADINPWIRCCFHQEKRRITPVVKTIFSEQVEKEGAARCLNAGCDYSANDVKLISEHYKGCDKIRLDYKCAACSFLDSSEFVMINHVRTAHSEKALEFKERGNSRITLLEGGPAEMPELAGGKYIPYLKAAEANSRKLLYLQPALVWTYKMKKEFVAPGWIFPELSNKGDTFRRFDDFPASHFSLRDSSMRIACNKKTPLAKEWISLNKLTSFKADNNILIMYTGGVVRSLDWIPSNEEQYLVVAIGSISETINVKSTKSGPGHLQIWSAGRLNNFEEPSDSLKFEFALCHDFGEVWDLQCCPGGEPSEERLGLVALATSSGKVAVYAVPSSHSSSAAETLRAAKLEPALILETGLHESFQVSKVAWSKVKPHRFVAGGFTNGMVAVWDLTTNSVLLKTGNTILPFKMFHPHFITITGLSFSPVHEHYLVTSCADKSSKFFNLEDTSVSHVEFNRGLFMDVAWLHHWMSAVAAIDDNTTLGTTTATINPLRCFIYQAYPCVTQVESCCLSISVNDWLNAFVCSYDSGQVLLTFALKHRHVVEDRKRGHSQLISPEFHSFNPTSQEMIDCQSYDATSENFGVIFNFDFSACLQSTKLKQVPLSDVAYFPSTAANKVCWNPNINSFLTMAVGYHSGFVVLGRIKLPKEEMAEMSSLMSEISKCYAPAPSGSTSSDS